MDEFLMDRVRQLQEIEERLEKIYRADSASSVFGLLDQLRRDVQDMRRKAEAEYAAF